MASQKSRILIDCDPGHDDVFAIGVAAKHCDIVGITTVAGNSPLENTTRNALIATELFGLESVAVHRGASGPIDGTPGHFAFDAHGRTGLDGPVPRIPKRTPASDDAVGFIIETIRAEEGLWLAPIGPLTNIALAIRRAPDIVNKVAGVSIMGGSISFGNVTSAAEFNIWFDPEAASEVFESGAPLRMCGLDLTHQVLGDGVFRDTLLNHGTDSTRFCGELMAFYHAFSVSLEADPTVAPDLRGAPLHDPCAILAISHPEQFEMNRLKVGVECTGTLTRGMTLADLRPWAKRELANCDVVAKAVDPKTSVATILDALLAF